MKKETAVTAVILCVLVALAGIFYLRVDAGDRTEPGETSWETVESQKGETLKEAAQSEDARTTGGQSSGWKTEQTQGADSSDFAVYICGAVKHPGVYYFSPEARVCDAVNAAGGFTKKADIQAVNQARVLADGEQITIPKRISSSRKKGEHSEETQTDSKGAEKRINLNTAELSELMTIPGIGEAKAQMIIEYRTENGSFRSTEDIMKISGIKEGIYNQIKDYITV